MDLLIAVCALLLSAVAAMAAVLQTRAIENQLSATVWPYLSFSSSQSNTEVRYTLENDGLGPAILESASLTMDGARKHAIREVAQVLVPHQPKRTNLGASSLNAGEVLRPGESAMFFRFSGSPLARSVAAQLAKRVRVTVCYCSLLEQCWTLTSGNESHGPVKTPRCDTHEDVAA